MSTRPSLWYVAHPIGRDDRGLNLIRARIWLDWLLRQYPERAFTMPWLPYCEVLEESDANRTRGMRDDKECLLRCDGIVLVGGRHSPGMIGELALARLHNLLVNDLTILGTLPPPAVLA